MQLTKLETGSLDLVGYELSLFEITTHTDPRWPDEGTMTIRAEGWINSDYIPNRLALLNAVLLPPWQNDSDLYIRTEGMDEDAVAAVVPKQQTIPMHNPSSEFILVWESNLPYFVGVLTGGRYP